MIWKRYKELAAQLRNLRGSVPEVMKGFATLAQTALASKALDGKTKELIALAIAVAVRCDDCIGFHVKAAVAQGASREEVAETLGMAIYMGAGCTPATRWKRSISSPCFSWEAQQLVNCSRKYPQLRRWSISPQRITQIEAISTPLVALRCGPKSSMTLPVTLGEAG